MTTARRRLIPGEPGEGGYRGLVPADGEQHRLRTDLSGVSLRSGWQRSARALLCIAHLSDTHVMDHQSPGRAELFDRFADLDSPLRGAVGIIGCYRAQELFTFQVADAMARAVRRAATGPVSGAPVDFAIVTGDATDNCQLNELRACIDLLDGSSVVPDSGCPGQLGRHRRAGRLGRACPRACRQRLAGQRCDHGRGRCRRRDGDDRNVILLVDWPRP